MSDILEEVKARMIALVEGSASREDVADWALVRYKHETADYHLDEVLWTALGRLVGADLQQAPGVYLHDEEDFRSWLADLDA